jgi:hypothetical protein
MNSIKLFLLGALSFTLIQCTNHPVLPESKDIKVSRDAADEDCKSLGTIQGKTMTSKGTSEEALEDLKKDAVRKGANYVQIQSMGAMATSIQGEAYYCQ